MLEMATNLFSFASYVCTKLNGFAYMRFYMQTCDRHKICAEHSFAYLELRFVHGINNRIISHYYYF